MDYQNVKSFIAKICGQEQLECVSVEVSTAMILKIAVSVS
jgi:hypothetical protein